jgi:hypothetical protein
MAERVDYDKSMKHAESYVDSQVKSGRLSERQAGQILRGAANGFRKREYERQMERFKDGKK